MLKYIGEGASLAGIPARDLTDEEVDELGGEEKILATGLYSKPTKKTPKAAVGAGANKES